MTDHSTEIVEKDLAPLLIAGCRMKGRYEDIGQGFKKIGRAMGFLISGKPLALFYDGCKKEDGADFEPCMPVRKEKDVPGIDVRLLEGGRAVTAIHRGPYETLHHTWDALRSWIDEGGYQQKLPSREVYIKGPGMLFKGNPKKYITEIQILVEPATKEKGQS